jgi:hypothetical protein
LDGGVAHADERADSGAVHERNPGEVDVEYGRSLITQRYEQTVA